MFNYSLQTTCSDLAANVSKHQEYEDALRQAERALLQVTQEVASQGAVCDESFDVEEGQEQLAKQQVSCPVNICPVVHLSMCEMGFKNKAWNPIS